MKTSCSKQRNHGLTLLEAVVVIFIIAVLAATLLPATTGPRHRQHLGCANNQKQIGLAFRIWAGDNNDKYPMAVSSTNGGAMEAAADGSPLLVFQVMSNELSTAKVLLCPEGKYEYATNFGMLTASNVSYFVNPDAVAAKPQEVMSGDDNFEIAGIPVKSGLLKISTATPVAWSAQRHKFSGYLMMADGSVQAANNSQLKGWLWPTNSGGTAIRLAIP